MLLSRPAEEKRLKNAIAVITIEGVRCGGLNAAHENLAKQLPLIAAEFPEIADCYHGTINVQLVVPLLVVAPNHRSQPIHWDDVHFPNGEVFDFLRIQFEAPLDAAPVTAWLYIPHGSPARRSPWIHEVLAAQLDIPSGAQCRVRIDRNAAQLPYHLFPQSLSSNRSSLDE